MASVAYCRETGKIVESKDLVFGKPCPHCGKLHFYDIIEKPKN